MKDRILQELGVQSVFDVAAEAERRIQFLADYLKSSGAACYVLGISGGIDSTTAGLLAQAACDRVCDQEMTNKVTFVAVRLPYGVQRDEAEAQDAIKAINPDIVLTVNIKPPTDEMLIEVFGIFGIDSLSNKHSGAVGGMFDFVKGNIKARQRMIAQYTIAGANNGLVIGTDHNAEAVMGFFTKFGDGACDITPLAGLNKRQVRALGKFLGAPDALVNKTPTADLEDLDPGKPDEFAYGVTYDQIDDFLEGKQIDQAAEDRIIEQYTKTIHKRELPVTP